MLLRAAWTGRTGGWRMLAAWLILACGVFAWRLSGAGWDKAVAFAALAPTLIAFVVVAARADIRPKDSKTKRPKTPCKTAPCKAEPPLSAGPLWRGLVRTVLAGPLSGLAAVGLAVAADLRAPWSEADGLVAAGFIAPLAWAGFGVWATTDERLGRVGVVLSAIALASFGWARF